MRRYDKKQVMLEANLRLIYEDDEKEFDALLEEIKLDFTNGELNEGLTMAVIGGALASGKLLDLLASGIRKITKFLVKKGWMSEDGKAFKRTEKVSSWC